MAQPVLSDARKQLEEFKSAVSKDNLSLASGLLLQLKLKLTQFPSLPPLYQQTPNMQDELLLARDVLEHAVVLSVKQKDEAAFERNFLQLKAYYTDTGNLLPPSPQEHSLLGLNLLRLLVQNRIAEFHTELELLPLEVHAAAPIQQAIELEQSLMEGAYMRVLVSSRERVNDPLYGYFLDLLMQTVRDEIAGCSEKAYELLTVEDARKVLMLPSDAELKELAESHKWEVRDGCVYFQSEIERQQQLQAPHKEIPAMHLISQSLGYARELERIV
eukprot:TRINITY_DN779_c0_g1_i1.p1 TRINITY_DN779_c0_g1~~TRINITY_DN779_c0_g1_i1.p1  ORF type:complete len:273 (-),score=83.77 TRINITY_DN779_c0_g1_i1:135-953(-)